MERSFDDGEGPTKGKTDCSRIALEQWYRKIQVLETVTIKILRNELNSRLTQKTKGVHPLTKLLKLLPKYLQT